MCGKCIFRRMKKLGIHLTSALCRRRPSVLPILFWNQHLGVVVISDVGGTGVGDVDNLKIWASWTFHTVFVSTGVVEPCVGGTTGTRDIENLNHRGVSAGTSRGKVRNKLDHMYVNLGVQIWVCQVLVQCTPGCARFWCKDELQKYRLQYWTNLI